MVVLRLRGLPWGCWVRKELDAGGESQKLDAETRGGGDAEISRKIVGTMKVFWLVDGEGFG
jgi:hypothetical protein